MKNEINTKHLNIKQDVNGSPYFECTTEFGTMAKVSLNTLKKTLAWVYEDYKCDFKVELSKIERRRYTADA